MNIEIRDAIDDDLDTVTAINEASVPHVNSLPVQEMRRFHEQAAWFRVAVAQGETVGFLVGMTPDMDYGSSNFLWFRSRYDDFAYIDRIAVTDRARRLGIGSALYDDFERRFSDRAPRLACEVNLRPPNPASMRFHLGRGFRQVGTQETEGGTKQVALLIKDL